MITRSLTRVVPSMRVYYAHAMVLYGTEIEKAEMEIIRTHLSGYELVDPGEYEGNPEKSEQAM